MPDPKPTHNGEDANVEQHPSRRDERDDYPVARVTSDRMVGRREELGLLVDLTTTARGGQPAVGLVSGDAGIGKTRLVDEFTRTIGSDTRTIVTQCHMPAEAVPLSALAGLLRHTDAGGPMVAGAEAVVESVLHGLSEPLSPLSLCEGVTQVVLALAGREPLVLIVEDLHWADATTRNVVGYLARRLESAPIVLLLTYRSDELHRRHPLRPFLGELERQVGPHRIELAPLTRGELAELAEEVTGTPPGTRLLDRIAALSDGNPFFAEELLASRGSEIPTSVRDAVLGRVASLGSADARLLHLASAAGSTIDPGVLAEVAGADLGWVQERLGGLIQRHHLVSAEDGARFRHTLAQEVLYDELLPTERTALHAAYATALMSSESGHIGRVAHHLWLAGDRVNAFRASIEAGEVAVSRGAHAEALVAFERALEAWDRGAADGLVDHPTLVLRTAKCAEQTRDFDRGIGLLEREISLGALDPATEADLAVQLAILLWHANRPNLLDPLDRAMGRVDPGSAHAVDLLIVRAGFLLFGGRLPEALEAAAAALHAATALDSAERIGAATLQIQRIRSSLGDPGYLEVAAETIRAAEQEANTSEVIRAGVWSVVAANQLGEFDHAISQAEATIAATREVGTYLTVGVIAEFQRLYALERTGRWDEAEASATRLLADLGQFQHHWFDTVVMGVGLVWVRRGTPDPADLLGEGYRVASAAGFVAIVPARTAPALMERAVEAGDHDAARAIGIATLDSLLPGHPIMAAEVVATLAMVEAERALVRRAGSGEIGEDGLDAAIEWIERLEHSMQHLVRVPRWTAAFVARSRLEVARVHGDDDADAWAELAAEWQAVTIPYESAYARLREAEARLRGTAPDRAGATTALRAAFEIASALGAVPIVDTITRLGRFARIEVEPRAPQQPSPARPEVVGPPLTAREVDVLQLLVEGLSNGEIGRALFITTKTVSTHVSSILRKLGAANRVEAATIAHRLGLTQ